MKFNNVVIIGVGLIGGSFALAMRRAGMASRITAWGGSRSIKEALKTGVIDGIEDAFDTQAVSEADLIYLSSPISSIIEFLQTRGKQVKPGALVTDAGSTKRIICAAAREGLSSETAFIGGHPMAGSHKTGVEFASADLFLNAPYAIVRDPESKSGSGEEAARTLELIAREIGARPVFFGPADHDRAVAVLSHAPQLLSTALAAGLGKTSDIDVYAKLAGPGFDSMTRLAGSSWSIWKDICETNADEIGRALDMVMREISRAGSAASSLDLQALKSEFESANNFMKKLQEMRDHEHGITLKSKGNPG